MGQDEIINQMSLRVESIGRAVEDMNRRGLDNAGNQGRLLEKVERIETTLQEVSKKSHPVGCLTDRLVHAEEEALEAKKTAEAAKRAVASFKAGKGMTKREKWGLAGIGTALITIAEVMSKVFAK